MNKRNSLVLTRRINEKIIVEHKDEVMCFEIISFSKGQAKIRFRANDNFKVNREEIYHKINNNEGRG